MSVLRSVEFDDIYFSPDNGLEETRHNFLQGNNLPERFKTAEHFTIAESGFGTGLNFLAAAKLFADTAPDGATLDFISFEKYPLTPEQIRPVIEHWAGELGQANIDRLMDVYPLRVFAFHRIDFSPRIRLTLIFDDMNLALPRLHVPRGVDAWFLDGFAPSKNPDMWSDGLFENMARLSHSNTSVATFTAAGLVKRGLTNAGFEVKKINGYGRKREMITARFTSDHKVEYAKPQQVKSVAVIGSGLAGSSCAHILKRYGLDVCLYDKAGAVASYASGNDTGLYNPRLSAERTPQSAFYVAGYAALIKELEGISVNVSHRCNGALHLCVDAGKEKRLRSTKENWGWHEDHMHYLSAQQASEIAGIAIDKEALYLPDGGSVCPRALCEYLAQDVRQQFGLDEIKIEQTGQSWLVNGKNYDAVVLANAIDVLSYEHTSWLPLHTVRGQTTYIQASKSSENLHSNICYGGYISAAHEGRHVIGASFQRWLEHDEVLDEDDQDNLEKMYDALPSLKDEAEDIHIAKSWAGLRTSSQDRFPVIGRVADHDSWKSGEEQDVDGLYIMSALGSHGMVSAIAGAHLIADMIMDLPYSLPYDTVQQLSPDRFLRRAKKKGQL